MDGEGLASETPGTRTILNLVESRGGHFASGRRSNVSLITAGYKRALSCNPVPLLHVVAAIRRETTKKTPDENNPKIRFGSRDNFGRVIFYAFTSTLICFILQSM